MTATGMVQVSAKELAQLRKDAYRAQALRVKLWTAEVACDAALRASQIAAESVDIWKRTATEQEAEIRKLREQVAQMEADLHEAQIGGEK